MVDLDARTRDTLDWAAVLTRLAHHARTTRGAAAATGLLLVADRAAAKAHYEAVAELIALEEDDQRLPIGAITDIADAVERAATGRVLEAPELIATGRCLRALEDLRIWLTAREADAPRLFALATPIEVDPELLQRLESSFDERGELSERTYPELGELRRRIRSLQSKVQATLDTLVKGDALAGVLQDRFVTQRGDRYVLPIKAEAKRAGLGIVHDTSNSGETVYIEPAEVVELNNALRLAEAALRREIARILRALSQLVGRFAAPIAASLDAAAAIDLTCARVGLGRELRGVIPTLGAGGVLHLVQARHPVLSLRGIEVVPNDLSLDGETPGMVLSGPNTGGKTVALKTLGLAALFCRAGIPFPAAEGSRVDVFPDVIADIGDLQTVEGDLSTFSGHVLVLKEVLRRARPGVLVLLDEVAVGTDPAQGGALARAVLEVVVEAGARLAVTTHYTELKAFATTDPRFVNAAVHLEDGQPAYRVQRDTVGLSHAFSTARRLGLDPTVVDRAEGFLSAEAQALGGLLEQLERERQAGERLRRDLERQRAELDARQAQVDDAWRKIRGRTREIAQAEAQATLDRLARVEDEVKAVIAALQARPDLARAGRSLQAIRALKEEAAPPPAPSLPKPPPPRALQVGDRVRVHSLGKVGRVISLPRKGLVEVDLGGLHTRVKLRDLVGMTQPEPEPEPAPPPQAPPRASLDPADLSGVRIPSNTLDLRGKRVEEAVDALEPFVDQLIRRQLEVGFVLHGHGTGALKRAVREALPGVTLVRAWRPANENEGGDAFTIVGV
ncbi:MAG: Smr/MutS family protein [Alphaproteobacteria bacterium]|nr:Smr/MutS family protein [Alphaproteobacteria bacterium]